MNIYDNINDKIDAYLTGELTAEGALEFEKEIMSNDALSEQVKLFRLERQAIDRLIEKDLRSKMQKWKTEGSSSVPTKRRPPSKKLLLAVPFILAGIIIFLFIYPPSSSNEKELSKNNKATTNTKDTSPVSRNIDTFLNGAAAEPPSKESQKSRNRTPQTKEHKYEPVAMGLYSETDFGLEGVIVRKGNTDESTLDLAIEAFNDSTKNFSAIVAAFNKVDKSVLEERLVAQEYLAHAYFRNKKPAESIRILNMLLKDQSLSTSTVDDLEWLLLLSLIMNNKVNAVETKQLMDKMANPENYHAYEQRVKELGTILNQ